MIPLHDDIPARSTPVVNYVLITLTLLVFVIQLIEPPQLSLVERLGMVPRRVVQPQEQIVIRERVVQPTPVGARVVERERRLAEAPVPNWLTLFTSIFLHGGWLHVIGNMWFLYVFGDNVEDRYGRLGFVGFYLGTGVLAGLAHLISNPGSVVPTVGASGAIAGVMGAYFWLYPRAKVLTLVPIFIFLTTVVVPAPVFLAVWFLFQFFQGAFSVTDSQSGGVAWWAHIGGFVAGAGITWLLDSLGKLRPPPRAGYQEHR